MDKYIRQRVRFSGIISILLLIADASLIIRIGIVKPYTLQLFEFFILLCLLLSCISWAMFGIDSYTKSLYKKYGKIFLLVSLFLIVGTISASLLYGITQQDSISLIKDFFYLFTVFLGLVFHVQYAGNKKFRDQAYWLMSLPLVFAIFLVIPSTAGRLGLLGNSDTLVALHNNQSVFAIYLLIPLAFFSIKTIYEKKYGFKMLSWLAGIFSFSLILWTGSRGAWLASCILFLSIAMFNSYENILFAQKIKRFVVLGFCIIISITASFFILPHSVKVMALDRVFPSVTNYHPDPETLNATKISLNTIFSKPTNILSDNSSGTPVFLTSPAYQDRQHIWPKALNILIHHPEGLGPEYAAMSAGIIGPDGHWIPSHNTFLQIALSGGVLLLALMLYLLWIVSKKLYQTAHDPEKVLLFSLWISTLFALLFNDHFLALPWVWIIAGIILAKTKSRETA